MSRKLVDGKHPVPSPGSNPGGAPSLLERDKDLPEKIRKFILMGAPVLTAAALNDVSYDTMRSWVLKAKENPESEYGALIRLIMKAVAEWEVRDLAVLDIHATGRPATYLEEPVLDKKGQPYIGPDGKALMKLARDKDGNPIQKTAEVKSDWRAAMERLSRRKPRTWAAKLAVDIDSVLTFDPNAEKQVDPKDNLSFEQRIATAVKELEDEY